MSASTTDALFVTANVGSIFEEPTSMLKIWCDEFLTAVSRINPKIVALHCQEVGGKNYERSMQHVAEFVQLLLSSKELQLFDKVRIYLDEDYSSAEHFTALGNFYFIHESITEENVQIFNFQEGKFEPVTGKEVHTENIEDVPTKEKSKFPQETFPECKWSRKGFMRTRWNLNGTVFDLINIHLFHDASNFVAMESFPSVYCKNRQRALEHTLKRFHTDQYGTVPFFVFGDFNFRTDTQGVVKKLSEGLNAVKIQSSKSTDHAKLQYRDESSQQVVLTLGKKEFSHHDHQKLFVGDDSEWLREFDRELESFSGQLFEFNINFPPSYPYVEDSERGEMYMQTRCPSWCDRVFLSSSARLLVNTNDGDTSPEYGLIGLNACMGDHKPVYLRAALIGELGTVSCCALPAAPCTSSLSSASPVEHLCRLCSEPPVESSSFPYFDEPEQDHTGLVVPKFHRHTSPYTPESTDTEPDQGEEMSPTEERLFVDSKNDWHKHRKDTSSRKHIPVSCEPQSIEEPALCRSSSSRRSSSKIPVRIHYPKENVMLLPPHVSKIPVAKHTISKHDKDACMKAQNGKYISLSISSSKDNLDKRLLQPKDSGLLSFDSDVLSKQCETYTPDVDLISTSHSVEGRKNLFRQPNIDEQSTDSDTVSIESNEDRYLVQEQRTREKFPEDPKVEIQFSLVESSPSMMSHIECESDTLLTAQTLGLGGSTTDSGVSVSPDLSVQTSADSPSKSGFEQISNSALVAEDDPKVVEGVDSNPLSLERFSFVRRIQSASAMERKSSFPLPSTVFIENQPLLTGFGGSGSNLWGMRTCRCMSDGSWRKRSSTVPHSALSSRIDSRIRLISTSSKLDGSLPRLQSHHSSSEEDWFEEISNDLQEEVKSDNAKVFLGNEMKAKHNVVDSSKRLSTHEEYVSNKSSDPNIFSDDSKSNNAGLRPQLSCLESMMDTPNLSKQQSDGASMKATVNETIKQFSNVDAASVMTEGGSSKLVPNLELTTHDENEANIDSPVGKSVKKVDETVHHNRKSSSDSSCSKSQNSRNCKTCCTLL